jgi:hypothetical protein
VHDDCKIKFSDLKARRSFRFIVFKIDEKSMEIKVERLGETSHGYEEFTNSLPADECRYAVYDLDFVTDENCQKSKIFFFSWYVRTYLISLHRSCCCHCAFSHMHHLYLPFLHQFVINPLYGSVHLLPLLLFIAY